MTASITSFRARVARILADEVQRRIPRHLVIFALDGISLSVARGAWTAATIEPLQSVFPTTSSTAWLSSITGAGVADHGVPGVVFRIAHRCAPVDVFRYRGPLRPVPLETVFTDAHRYGFRPVVSAGDLLDFDGTWRSLLLNGAELVDGPRFCTTVGGGFKQLESRAFGRGLRAAIEAMRPRRQPTLFWCFADLDLHIHRYGYDAEVRRTLAAVEAVALELSTDGCLVLAHADHGLAPTVHDPGIARTLEAVASEHSAALGGAGRCRWLYVEERAASSAYAELAARLPSDVAVGPASRWFSPRALTSGRIGAVVVVAEGARFLTPDGYVMDHGSWSEDEVLVPLADWSG